MDIWGNDNESTSSTLSTSSSTNSRDQDSRINLMAARQRIVDRIMERKRAEERQQDQQQQQQQHVSRDDVFKRPSPRIPTNSSELDERSMELTRVASTTPGKENRATKARIPPRGAPVYRSTPLPGQRTPGKSALPLFLPSDDEIVPENMEPEAESPPPSHSRSYQQSPAKSLRRAPPEHSIVEQSTLKSSKGQSARHSQGFEEDTPPRPKTRHQKQAPEKSFQKAPSMSKNAKQARTKSSVGRGARLSEVGEGQTLEEENLPRAFTRSQQRSPETSSKKAPSKTSHAKQSAANSPKGANALSSNSGVGPSSRRKNPPSKSTSQSRLRKTFEEIRRLQNATGYLLPRLSFMRVVREISGQVSTTGLSYRFTVDAMEAIQTAAEFYVSNVFADAFKLAIHARRVTVMPKDLDLLRTLKIIDS